MSFIVGDEDDSLSLVEESSDKADVPHDKFGGSFNLMDGGGSTGGKHNMEPAGFTDRRRRLRYKITYWRLCIYHHRLQDHYFILHMYIRSYASSSFWGMQFIHNK